ncbi:DUF3168 domain-containing protein [Streptomyces sp. NPDC049881]|uniref:DUF3168 domain-containing protein n=1 Tax=Streptomyces sp. NPDC049881 TaxID=3155778 RepID=UPI003422530A
MTVPTSPALPVQRALYARLNGDDELSGLVSGVHDGAPEPAPYPFVVLGEAMETPDNSHSGYGRQTVVTLHVWSRARGFAEGHGIAVRLVQLLDHQPLAVEGHHHIVTLYEFMQTLTDPEPPGDIRHVVLRFRVRTSQA